jgi:hypothetical protein
LKRNPVGSKWYYNCEREVPSVEEIKRCCHDLLDDIKRHGYRSLRTGGIIIETNDFGGVIKFNQKARIRRERRQKK